MKKTKDFKKEIIQRMVFYKMFNEMIEKEKSGSNFGVLLLQENLICTELIRLLMDLDHYFKVKLGLGRSFINIDANLRKLEEKTIGQLINVALLFFSERDDLIKCLKPYRDLRNHLTHKMLFGKYKETKDLYIDANKAYIFGQASLCQIKKLQKYFSQFYKMKMSM